MRVLHRRVSGQQARAMARTCVRNTSGRAYNTAWLRGPYNFLECALAHLHALTTAFTNRPQVLRADHV